MTTEKIKKEDYPSYYEYLLAGGEWEPLVLPSEPGYVPPATPKSTGTGEYWDTGAEKTPWEVESGMLQPASADYKTFDWYKSHFPAIFEEYAGQEDYIFEQLRAGKAPADVVKFAASAKGAFAAGAETYTESDYYKEHYPALYEAHPEAEGIISSLFIQGKTASEIRREMENMSGITDQDYTDLFQMLIQGGTDRQYLTGKQMKLLGIDLSEAIDDFDLWHGIFNPLTGEIEGLQDPEGKALSFEELEEYAELEYRNTINDAWSAVIFTPDMAAEELIPILQTVFPDADLSTPEAREQAMDSLDVLFHMPTNVELDGAISNIFAGTDIAGLELDSALEAMAVWAEEDPDGFIRKLAKDGYTQDGERILYALGMDSETIDQVFQFEEATQQLVPYVLQVYKTDNPRDILKWILSDTEQWLETYRELGYSQERDALLQMLQPDMTQEERREVFYGKYDRGFVGKFWDVWTQGSFALLESMAGGLEWTGGLIGGGVGDFLEEYGKAVSYMSTEAQAGEGAHLFGTTITSGGLNYKISEGLGWDFVQSLPALVTLLATSIPTGGAIGTLGASTLKLGKFGTFVLQSAGMSLVSRPLESFMEAGGLYQEAMYNGMSKKEAQEAATSVFLRNMELIGTDFIQFAGALHPFAKLGSVTPSLLQKGVLKYVGKGLGVAGVALSEGGEEYYQQIIQMQALGEDIRTLDFIQNWSNEEIRQVVFLGMMSGGAFAGGANLVSFIQDITINNLTGDVAEAVRYDIAEQVRAGVDVETAKKNSLDAVIDEPGVKDIIENVMKIVNSYHYENLVKTDNPQVASQITETLQKSVSETGLKARLPEVTPVSQQAPVAQTDPYRTSVNKIGNFEEIAANIRFEGLPGVELNNANVLFNFVSDVARISDPNGKINTDRVNNWGLSLSMMIRSYMNTASQRQINPEVTRHFPRILDLLQGSTSSKTLGIRELAQVAREIDASILPELFNSGYLADPRRVGTVQEMLDSAQDGTAFPSEAPVEGAVSPAVQAQREVEAEAISPSTPKLPRTDNLQNIEQVKKRLKTAAPRLNDEQISAIAMLIEGAAAYRGISANEYINTHLRDITAGGIIEPRSLLKAYKFNMSTDAQFVELYGDTNWGKAIAKAIALRQDIKALIEGTERSPDPKLRVPYPRLEQLIKEHGIEGIWMYRDSMVAGHRYLGEISKTITALASSCLNCRPSAACAKFCYAYTGRSIMPEVLITGETLDILAEADPYRFAQNVANEFKGTQLYKDGKALRLFDRGEGSEHWLKVIDGLNKEGVRCHVFSKRVAFLERVDPRNVRMLSIDNTNAQIARDNNLPIAFNYVSREDNALLEEFKDRIQVVLPVRIKKGRESVLNPDIAHIPEEFKEYQCPVDNGRFAVADKYSAVPQKGEWNCPNCDTPGGRGVGCYHGQTTSQTDMTGYETTLHAMDDVELKATISFQEDGSAIIRAFQNANVADMAHELGHLFRRDLTASDLAIVEEWAGVEDGIWTEEAEEMFAEGFEVYLLSGTSPATKMNLIFAKFKQWLSIIYKNFRNPNMPVAIPQEVRDVYDRLLVGAPQDNLITEPVNGGEITLSKKVKPTDPVDVQEFRNALDFVSDAVWKEAEITPKQLVAQIEKQRGRKITKSDPVTRQEIQKAVDAINMDDNVRIRLLKEISHNIYNDIAARLEAHNKKKFTEVKTHYENKIKEINQLNRDRTRAKEVRKRERDAKVASIRSTLNDYIESYLPRSERGDFNKAIQSATSVKDMERILHRLEVSHEQYWQKALRKQISYALRRTKAKKYYGIKKGKYTAEAQELLDNIRDNMKEERIKIRAEISANVAAVEEGKMLEEECQRRNAELEMQGIEGMSSEELQHVLDNIKYIKEEGKALRQDYIEREKARIQKIRDEAIDVVTGGEGLKPGRGTTAARRLKAREGLLGRFANLQYGLDDLIDKISQRDKSDPFQSRLSRFVSKTVHSARNAETVGIDEQHTKIRGKLKEIYGLKRTKQVDKLLKEMDHEVSLGWFTNGRGEQVEIIISRNQAMKKYQERKDPTLDDTFRDTSTEDSMAWTDEIIEAVEGMLTDQDVAWADYQMEFYRSYYPSIDAVYAPMFGVHLGFNPYYSPINRDVMTQTHPEHLLVAQELQKYATEKSRSLKARVPSREALEFKGANEVFVDHINQMEHFKAWAQAISDLRRVFGNRQVRIAIAQYHGDEAVPLIDEYINNLARGGTDRAKVSRTLDFFRKNFTRAILGLKPDIALKQVPSVLAFSTGMPIRDFVTGVASFWTNPIGNYNKLKEFSPYLRARVGQGYERDIKFALGRNPQQVLSGKGNFLDFVMFLIRQGDRLAVTQGMWAKYQSMQRQNPGMSDADAIFEAELLVERTQPTSTIESLSPLQNRGSTWKMLTMFQNQPNKYFRLMGQNFRNFQRGRGSRPKAVLNIATAWVVLPALFQLVADGLDWEWKHQGRAWLLGPMNYLLVAGQMFQTAYNWWWADETFPYQFTPITDWFTQMLKGGKEFFDWYGGEDFNADDFIKMIEYFAKGAGELVGVPTPYLMRVFNALYDQRYAELVFSRWALSQGEGGDVRRTDGQSVLDKLRDAEDLLLSEIIDPDRKALLSREYEIYGLNDYKKVFNKIAGKINLADITEANGFSKLAVSCAEAYISEAKYSVIPNVPLYQLNADEADGDTFEDFYRQWKYREILLKQGDMEALDEFDSLYREAYKGNFTVHQLDLLRQYHDLPEDKREAFLEKHPDLANDPQEVWLKNNPEDNARLFLWGEVSKIYSDGAATALMNMMNDMEISDNLVKGIPPREILPDYFEYIELSQEHGAGSLEVDLFLLEHEEYLEWAMEPGNWNADGLKRPSGDINSIRITVNRRKEDAEYTALETYDEKQEYLRNNENYRKDRVLRDMYDLEVPEELQGDYKEYRDIIFEHGSSSSEAKLYRLEHPEFDNWGQGEDTMKWKEVKGIKEVLEINVDYATDDEAYDDLETRDDKRQYLLDHWSYQQARYLRDSYADEVPEDLRDLYIEYKNVVFKHGGTSAEAKLFRLDHPELGGWAKDDETLGWKPINSGNMTTDAYIRKLRIDTEFAAHDDAYADLSGVARTTKELADLQAAYLIKNPDYARARIERDGLVKGIPENMMDLWIEFKEGGYRKGSSRGDAWLWKHYDFFLAVREILDWGPLDTHTIVGTSYLPGWQTRSYLPGEIFVPAGY